MRKSAWLGVLLTVGLPAQTTWTDLSRPVGPGPDIAMAYDEARGEFVLFDGRVTWVGDGTGWQQRSLPVSPPIREHHAMTYDAGRQRVVLFGGRDVVRFRPFADTWEWDGSSWGPVFAGSPVGRSGHAMTYDSARGRIVMFGGETSPGTVIGDTWEHDGTTWQQVAIGQGPPARSEHTLTFDAERGQSVLFGGIANGSFPAMAFDDTWTWDGTAWSQKSPSAVPPARADHGAVWDPVLERVRMFAGSRRQPQFGGSDTLHDAWQWDGTDWSSVVDPHMPVGRVDFAIAFDPARGAAVTYGGRPGAFARTAFTEAWAWSGAGWQSLAIERPVARMESAMVRDRQGRMVMFGGNAAMGAYIFLAIHALDDTLLFETTGEWSIATPATRPSRRYAHAMATDPLTGNALVFGGTNGTEFGDTWTFDGAEWREHVVTGPPARRHFAMATDPERGELLLFGGYAGGDLGDTWRWDGVRWTQLSPRHAPSARSRPNMAYDARRGCIVLFGGYGFGQLADTWEWSGRDWIQRFPATSPAVSLGHELVFDEARGVIALIWRSVWEYDGTNWTRRSPTGSPPPVPEDLAVAYDLAREQIITHGGGCWIPDQNFEIDDSTRAYGPIDPAIVESLGIGCAGSVSVPTLAAEPFSRPWLGDVFALHATELAPGRTALLGLGASKSMIGSATLPYDLGALGAPGCSLIHSHELLLPLGRSAGSARIDLAIPVDPILLGQPFYAQVWSLDRNANALGVVVSNGIEATVGAR